MIRVLSQSSTVASSRVRLISVLGTSTNKRRIPLNSSPLYNSHFASAIVQVRYLSSSKEGDSNSKIGDGTSEVSTKVKPSKGEVVLKAIQAGIVSVKDMIVNPKATWASIKEVAHHYWVGSKLLWSEMKLTKDILGRVLKGHEMSRRERRQLIRTTTDMFRLVPFAVFVIVPFMEFLLPFALKLFPNMLPSTFQDTMKEEENMKKELQMRLAVAKFFQDTMQEMASKKTTVVRGADGQPLPSSQQKNGDTPGATELLDFVESAQKGRAISNDTVIKMAKHFKDELTLPNIARPQLVSMCRYMGISPYGSDSILRFQLRNKLRAIKEDDRRILWEGADSLNTLELREACRERGMRSSGLTQFKLKSQLQEWLELSTQKGIPISLLIMSRAFNLTTASDEPEEVLKSSMSALDADTINEIVVATATGSEADSLDMRRRKLESLKFQQEMIAEEIGRDNGKSDKNNNSNNSKVSLTDGQQQQKQIVQLTAQEIQALSDLARSVSKENLADNKVLQAAIEALLISSTSTSNNTRNSSSSSSNSSSAVAHTVAMTDAVAARSLQRLRQVFSQALLATTAASTATTTTGGNNTTNNSSSSHKVAEKVMNQLDQNQDGSLSGAELRAAFVTLLQTQVTPEEVAEMVRRIDHDQDGQISLSELVAFLEKEKASSV